MTADVFGPANEADDPYSPEHVAALVAYLASPSATSITGQVFVVYGGVIAVLAPPTVAEQFADLDAVGTWFADRDPEDGFAADEILKLAPE